jgi:hypothetical protein
MGIGKGKKEELGKGDNRPCLNRAKIDREELLLIIDIAVPSLPKGWMGSWEEK